MKNANDMTVGRPLKVILFFAIPMLLGNIFQQIYNLADTAIVGHILGDKALAAVGASGSVVGLFMGLAFGIPNGFSIVVARYFGAKQYDQMKRAVASSMVIGGASALILSIIGVWGIESLLVFLNTPAEILPQAVGFVRIILAFLIVTMAYNVFAGILRGIGNSTMPLVFLIISCGLNVILAFLFVKVFEWGINGSAYATVISQAVSALLCYFYIRIKCPILKVEKKDFVYDGYLVKDLVTTGFSMGMMFSIVSIGSVALQSAINGLGTHTITAHIAARKFVEMMMFPLSSLSMSASTFASQNLGAGQNSRIKAGIKASLLLAAIWSGIVNLIGIPGARIIVELISGTENAEVISAATMYIRINVPFYFILIFLLVLRTTLQGMNHKVVPLLASFVELLSKFAVVAFLVPPLGYLGVCLAEPIIWIICALMVIANYLYVSRKMKMN